MPTDHKLQDTPDGAVTTINATDIFFLVRDPTGTPIDYRAALLTATKTFTNTRINPRNDTSEASSATPTLNTDNYDIKTMNALAANITSMTTNLSGTPVDGQKIRFRFLDNGTARTIAWGASFASMATLPTTTTISKWLYVDFDWSSSRSKYLCVGVIQEQ